ncbi:MAG TPA: TaqI-like C-terminal specificity domain-containing protein [Ignavibacteriaceae bacterium]|nr:TaqI-like C-terminal specificity domain-containing protein [Ignavibacteriaceae bacterium]
MSSFETAFKSISELVKDFKSNEKFYLSSDYSEADVRNDFINKFFIALGWDVRHETQKNPYEQEVRVEKPVQVAKAQKRADFTFYLSPNFRDVKFFVEAKKPYHDLEHKDYFFQTIRYGWNANTPIALLTDFEEFIILDCRYRPDIKDILNSKIKSFHYSDYADEEKFREIYYLFSRESVLDNSIEKYAESLPKPRGKAVKRGLFKGGFQSIDESFLEELDEIRTSLAKSFKKNNAHLTSDELTEATQRTIDRLVFIKFLEDKLIEPHHYVSEFGNRRTAWEDFITASISLDAKYNGVVFKKSLIDSKNIIEPDDKIFSNICEGLSHDNTPYNFDAIPIHILGSIYERFLGKVVNATDKRVTIEEKPEVRKAGGVYYTPQYIVNYIVDNTIGKLIEGKTPKEISKLRFADIACGSGSFLITVYERILDYHKQWYLENPEQAKKDGCIYFEGAYRLSLQQKQKILTNNIYGVDLDSQAVEVTQLSLYLKLLEDETTATANDTWVMFKEQLLPDLNKNIVCGNSLIGTDILEGNLFDYDEEKKLKPMDFETVFPEIMKAGGFDAIVGNPPYLKLTLNNNHKELFKYYDSRYKSLKGGSSKNLFQLFIEKALLLSQKSISYIVPEALLTTSSNNIIRSKMLNNYFIESLAVFDKFVFKDATIGTVVFNLSKGVAQDATKVYKLYPDARKIEIKVVNLNKKDMVWDTSSANVFSPLIDKISSKSIQMKELVDMSKGMVVKNRDNYLKPKPFNKSLPFLLGSSMKRYYHEYEFFGKYEELIIIGGTRDYYKQTKTPRLLIRRTGSVLCATYSDKTELIESTLYILTSNKVNLYYLLGLLNSKLLTFYLKQKLITNIQGYPQILMGQLNQLPIINLRTDNPLQIKIISFVEQILISTKQLYKAKTESDKNYLERKCESLDNQIDKLVYELYGLTEEEIKIVEGK